MTFKLTIEIPLLLCFFGFMISGPVTTNLMVYRTCYVILGYNKSDCALLGTVTNNETKHLETLVEPTVNVINTVKSTFESIATVIILMFIGPWSDRFGRKPVIISSLIGFAISAALLIPFSYFDISPWYMIICSIPMILTGGAPTFITVVLSYIADISTDADRSMRMVSFEAMISVGSLLGNLSSSSIFYATSYEAVYAIMSLCICLAILWVMLFVPESLQNVETEGKFRGFFEISNLIDTFRTTIRPRENFHRAIILLSILVLTLVIFTLSGDGLTFLYLRDKFEWTLEKYTMFSAAQSVVGITGAVFGTLFLRKVLKLPESVTILVGLICVCNGATLTGLAKNDAVIYAAACVKGLGGVISPMVRSMVAKLADPEEVGKIFSVIMISEFLIGLAANPLYTVLYNSTIDTNPGIFNYLSAALFGLDAIIEIIIIVMQSRKPDVYQILAEDAQYITDDEVTIN